VARSLCTPDLSATTPRGHSVHVSQNQTAVQLARSIKQPRAQIGHSQMDQGSRAPCFQQPTMHPTPEQLNRTTPQRSSVRRTPSALQLMCYHVLSAQRTETTHLKLRSPINPTKTAVDPKTSWLVHRPVPQTVQPSSRSPPRQEVPPLLHLRAQKYTRT